jgi:hypothetical protein
MEYCDDDRHYIRPQRVCSGNGTCLTQTMDCNTYGKDPDFTCEHDCQPLPCPNVAVCGKEAPLWYFQCHRGRCWDCKDMFGKNLTFLEEPQECPVCFDVKPSVVQPNCAHSVCIDCFKRMRVDGPTRRPQPVFPFPDREDEYDTSDGQHRLLSDPTTRDAIRSWLVAMDVWDDEWNQKWQGEEHLRKCPLCRS